MTGIFSTYSTGENRVTASLLAVLQSLSLGRTQRLIGALLEQSEFELVRFQNQPGKDGKGVPDAVIHASIRLLIETKIARNSVDIAQLQRHLGRLDAAKEDECHLLVITPDDQQPAAIDAIKDERLVWTSFAALSQAIDEILGDKFEVTSEREAFLLRALQTMLEDEGLLAGVNDVVVVAARNAWPEYLQIYAYLCQPGRSFQHVSRLAFYAEGRIQPVVPKILESHDDIVIEPGRHSALLGQLVDRLIREDRRKQGERFKVLLLSAPDAGETLKLPKPVPNDQKSSSGKGTAYTMGQRYTTSERLLTAKTTSDLV